MKYTIEFKSDALKFISKQPKAHRMRIINSISKLPLSGDIKKLIGIKPENLYRLRIRFFQNNLFYKY